MGKIRLGILGGFSGKVGTVIGSSWKSTDYMHALAKHVKNPNTEGQQMQRNRFRTTVNFLTSMLPFIQVGFKQYAKKQTEFNAAVSYTLKNAIAGEYPEYTIDYEKVLVSRGKLAKVYNGQVSVIPGEVKFTWGDNSDERNASADDIAMALVYDSETTESFFTTRGEGRRRGIPTQVINIPARNVGHKIETYLSFMSADGKQVSNSVFLGELIAQ